LSDEELDALMPPGFKILAPPSGLFLIFILVLDCGDRLLFYCKRIL